MEKSTIIFKTIEFINGTKYLLKDQVNILCRIMCDKLGLEKTEENFSIIREACEIYFNRTIDLSE